LKNKGRRGQVIFNKLINKFYCWINHDTTDFNLDKLAEVLEKKADEEEGYIEIVKGKSRAYYPTRDPDKLASLEEYDQFKN